MKTSVILNTTLFILSLYLCPAGLCQSYSADSLISKFNKFRENNLQEKIYVHTDQQFYLTGETIWFKVYCVDASFHKPLSISKVAYIELLDKGKTSVLQAKVELQNGHGSGSVFLPATLQSGNYVLRAYTQWMRNFGHDFYFEKKVTIVNPFVTPEYEKAKAVPLTAAFFPEGGHLVDNIESKVGFRISSPNNSGHIKGAVIDNNNDTVTVFKPLKFGLGNFVFTPRPGHSYKAVVTDVHGQKSIHPFPESKPFGYVMSVAENNNRLTVTVTGNFPHADTANVIYLLTHTRQINPKVEVADFNSRKKSFTIDTNKLPEGITHLTVFDEQQKPVCERLYFKRPVATLQLNAKTARQEYRTRQNVNLEITSSMQGGPQVNDHISVAVYKNDSLSEARIANIHNYLWLLSDLSGNIESPEYYFDSNDSLLEEATDNLMLTHGWRRFKWEQISDGKSSFKFLPEYRGHLIKAKVTKNDSPAEGVLSFLSIPGTNARLFPGRSNGQGEVIYEVGQLKGRSRLITQVSQDVSARIQFESPFSTEAPATTLPVFILNPDTEKELLTRSIAMQVQDIYHEETGLKPTPQDSISFYGHADETYHLDDYTRFQVMEEVMREYVPGVFVRKRQDGFYFIVIDIVNDGVFKDDPMIMLDGVPLFDADKIMAVDPRKIKKLEVIKRRYFFGSHTMDGIVSYTTYNGDVAGVELDPSSVVIDYEGIQAQREFVYPKYDTQKQFESRTPDRRYLLYWNPHITTKNGTANLEFSTSDIKGNFLVVIEGITDAGLAGSTSCIFTVN